MKYQPAPRFFQDIESPNDFVMFLTFGYITAHLESLDDVVVYWQWLWNVGCVECVGLRWDALRHVLVCWATLKYFGYVEVR